MRVIYTLLLLFPCIQLFSQNYFKDEFRKQNPIKNEINISIEEKIRIHKEFLENAKLAKNEADVFYAYNYLFDDYYESQMFVDAKEILLEADTIAFNNKKWQAELYSKNASLNLILNQDYLEAKNIFHKALKLYIEVKDSIGIVENQEQISAMCGKLQEIDSLYYYFNTALPGIRKYASTRSYAVSISNFSNSLSYIKKFPDALIFADSALQIAYQLKDSNLISIFLDNKSSILINSDRLNEAIEICNQCIKINKKNNWLDNLSRNYEHLAVAHYFNKDYRNAYEYLDEYYILYDSIKGSSVKLEINNLEHKYNAQKTELQYLRALEKSHKSTYWLERVVFLLFLIIGVVLLIYYLKRKRFLFAQKEIEYQEKEIQIHAENLSSMTKTLMLKNKQLYDAELKIKELTIDRIEKEDTIEQANNVQDQTEISLEDNLYNLRILTKDDWLTFKHIFEKAHPNYIQKIRTQFPTITEAEERMFVLIKLNLKSSEVAAILGISSDSVKKARNRLRKKINLDSEIKLEDYISQY